MKYRDLIKTLGWLELFKNLRPYFLKGSQGVEGMDAIVG
jgi:hypothetical protein